MSHSFTSFDSSSSIQLAQLANPLMYLENNSLCLCSIQLQLVVKISGTAFNTKLCLLIQKTLSITTRLAANHSVISASTAFTRGYRLAAICHLYHFTASGADWSKRSHLALG